MIKITLENMKTDEYLSFIGADMIPHLGEELTLPCGIKVTSASSKSNKFIENQVFHFFVDSITTIGLGVLSAYLYEKLRNVDRRIRIKVNDAGVNTDEEELKAKLIASMEREDDEC
jgi:hypothetical protein